MGFNFARLVGPLTAHQYISRAKYLLLIAFPVTYLYARNSNRHLDVAPILENTTQPLHQSGYNRLWLEQFMVLAPYWHEEDKRAKLSTEQRTELDLLRSLRWTINTTKTSVITSGDVSQPISEGVVQVDTESSFFSTDKKNNNKKTTHH